MFIEYEGYSINIIYIDLPPGSHGNSVPNEDGSFTMFLDPRDSEEMQMYGFHHEFDSHIKQKHFDNIQDKNADHLEAEAHGIVKEEAPVSDLERDMAAFKEIIRKYGTKKKPRKRRKKIEDEDWYLPPQIEPEDTLAADINRIRDILGIPRRR